MITWTKLRDGSWGVRIDGTDASAAHVPGATVTVLRRDGTAKDAVLGRLVFESLKEGLDDPDRAWDERLDRKAEHS